MSEVKVLPLPKVDARYGPIGGKYPERIRVAMADGTTHWYVMETEQPHPQLAAAIENIKNLEGYRHGRTGK